MKKRFLYLINLLKSLNIDWEKWSKRGDQGYQIGWRLLISCLVFGFLWFIISGLKDDGYSIQAFNMPKAFVDAGYSGPVMARELVDELASVEAFVSSVKEDALEEIQNNSDKPDLDVEVMGIGLTLNSITYHLRELMGRPNRSIGGEITDIDKILTFNLRITGSPVQSFAYDYSSTSRAEGLEFLTAEAAKAIIKVLDPYRIAVYHQRKENPEMCLSTINYMLKEKPEDTDWAYVAWGNLLNRKGELSAAAEKFEQATKINPELALAWRNWAWAEFRQKNYERSIELMKKSLSLDKQNADGWNGLAYALRQTGQWEAAASAYEKAIKYDPKNINWYGNYAELLMMQKDTMAFMDIFQKIQQNVELQDAYYYLTLSAYHRFNGAPDSAAYFLHTALELDPENLPVHHQLSNYYYKIGENEKAAGHARDVIRLAANTSNENVNYLRLNAHNNLAISFYEEAQFDSAYYHVNQAIRIDPDNFYPYSTLAETHGLVDNEEGFYNAIEKAMQLGFDVQPHLEKEPYNKYAADERFQQLIKRYLNSGDQ